MLFESISEIRRINQKKIYKKEITQALLDP